MIEITPDDRKAFDSMMEVLAHERQSIQAAYPPHKQHHIVAGWANACIVEALIIACPGMNDFEILEWLFLTVEGVLPKIRKRTSEIAPTTGVSMERKAPMAKAATAVKAKPKPVKLAKKPAAKRRGATKR